jgi:hypothetical protein
MMMEQFFHTWVMWLAAHVHTFLGLELVEESILFV